MSFFDVMYEPPLSRDEEYPLPRRVQIETSSACNRRCPFCPAGRHPQRQKLMDWDLFTGLISELAEWNFDGVLSMFLLNEPLLNLRLDAEIECARAALPRASIYVSTNSDLATAERLESLYAAGATVVNLNIYDEETAARLRDLDVPEGVRLTQHKYVRHRPGSRNYAVTDMRSPEKKVDQFYTRSAEERLAVTAPRLYCNRPMRHAVVTWDGRFLLCCALDPLDPDAVVVGSIDYERGNSLRSLWNSDRMHEYRLHLQERRRDLPGCDHCDARVSYAHVFRRVR